MRLPKNILACYALHLAHGVLAVTTDCKCTPEDGCWPTDDDWKGLNATLHGRLIKSRPPAAVCYESEPEFDRGACDEILGEWVFSGYHMEDPTSISYPLWAGTPCPPIFPNGTSVGGDPEAGDKGCTLGKYPSYVVNATGAEDIAAAIRWAAERNVRLNIKNTGHSHLGRSTAYGSLSIWTHNIRGVEFHENFESESCPAGNGSTPQMAATIAAGEVDLDVYEALDKHGAVAVGGANPTVGIVGWFTGGGHGFLSSAYGMGSDNVLEATVVLLNGTVVTTNACSHADLFWAIRGGGGGTFGVVTSVVMKAYPTPKTTKWVLTATLQDPTMEAEWWELMAEFGGGLKDLKDGGVQGYFYMLGPPVVPTLVLAGLFNLVDKPEGTVEELFEPFKQRLDGLEGAVGYESNVTTLPTWLESYGGDPQAETVASNIALGSWLLPAEAFEDPEAVSEVFQEVGPSLDPNKTAAPLIVSHLIANSDNRDLETALNPAWRDTVIHVAVGSMWAEGASGEEIQAVRDDVTYRQVAALKSLAPDSGAYFNEMDAFEPDWQRAAFGENYPRLKGIKDKYDPEGALWCRGCVGSEDWVEDEQGKLCRVDGEL